MAATILAALLMIFYYMAVLGVGIWGGRRVRGDRALMSPHSTIGHQRSQETKTPDDYLVRLFVANRNVPLALVIVSMTATWVGGGYLNGTAEAVFNRGLLWCHAPLGYALSLVFGGMLFAGRMRVTKSLTMLDPFQQHYGPWVAVPLLVPAVCGELLWTAAILSGLGDTVAVIMQFNAKLVILTSAGVTMVYTALGGIFSVTYTDAFQMGVTVVGLFACLPYIVRNNAMGQIGEPHSNWVGKIEASDVSQIIDQLLMATFGGIPWQVYFQRVLSARSVFSAKLMSYLTAIGCIVLAIPPAVIGAASRSANFTATAYSGPFNLMETERKNVLAYAVGYLAPSALSAVGLLAITAAVMSSVDSSVLSAATLITRNIYHFVLRRGASDLELGLALRVMVCGMGILAMGMAINVQSVFDMWVLSSDLVYVLLFPQFVGLFYLRRRCNAYGVVFGFAVGFVFRVLCGEPLIGLPALVTLPLYDVERGQQFPYRTACMLVTMAGLLIGSGSAAFAFRAGLIPMSLDVCRCLADSPHGGPRAHAETAPGSDEVSPSSHPTTSSPTVGLESGEVAAGAEEEHPVDSRTTSTPTGPSPPEARGSTPTKRKHPKSSKPEPRSTGSNTPSRLLAAMQRKHEGVLKGRLKK